MEKVCYLPQQHTNITIIIPAWNEAPNLQYVLSKIPYCVTEVILVDGHSTDETIAVARTLLPTIRIVEQVGEGKGDAIKCGLEAATGDIIVLMDADGSANPLEIPIFVKTLLAGNDFAKGSRFMQGGDSHDITGLRRVGNYGLVSLVNLLFGTRFSDLCYGYNAFWKHCLEHIIIDNDGFEIEAMINIRMYLANLIIAEVPSIEYRRISGKSHLHAIKDGWNILKHILQERRRLGRKKLSTLPPLLQHQPMVEKALSEEVVF